MGGVAGTEGAGDTAFCVVVGGEVGVVVVATLEVVVSAAWDGGASGRPEPASDWLPSSEQAPVTRARATTSAESRRMERGYVAPEGPGRRTSQYHAQT